MQTGSERGERFFLVFAWLIFGIVVACFGGKAIFDTENLPPITYAHHLHAIAMGAWYALFALQPTLIHLGKVQTHRRLGRLSPILVVAVVVLAAAITVINWRRIGDDLITTGNALGVLAFVALYAAAILNRLRPGTHKRLMVYASLSIITPALGRVPEIFDQPTILAAPVLLGLLLTPIVRDVVVRRRPHPAALIGFAAAFGGVLAAGFVVGAPGWIGVLEAVLGPRGGG